MVINMNDSIGEARNHLDEYQVMSWRGRFKYSKTENRVSHAFQTSSLLSTAEEKNKRTMNYLK